MSSDHVCQRFDFCLRLPRAHLDKNALVSCHRPVILDHLVNHVSAGLADE